MKQKIAKLLFLLLIGTMILAVFTACGSGIAPEAPVPSQETEPLTPQAETAEDDKEQEGPADAGPDGSAVLVAYFSATGTTKGVAEKIAEITGADLYEIRALEEYTAEDLNWHDNDSRTSKEQNDKSARPEIGSEAVSLQNYTTIYLGYPIWWGEEPRILDTFVESYDFTGITVIPFCTSGGSGIGRSGLNLEANAGTGNWLEGRHFSGSVSDADLQSWIGSNE